MKAKGPRRPGRMVFLAMTGWALIPPCGAQRIAYDEFDGAARAGWARQGIGEWAGDGAVEAGGVLSTVAGNSWRALARPVAGGTVWYAVTLRMRGEISGYASVVPAGGEGSQFSELGFNSAYGNTRGMWTAGGPVDNAIPCTRRQTFLQRYDLDLGRWSAWAAPDDGARLLGPDGQIHAEPMVRDAALGAGRLSHVYLTKESPQAIEIDRLAIACNPRDALTPATAGTPVADAPPPRIEALGPAVAALVGPASPLRIGERIAFFGDSITWQGGYIDLLERALARHVPDRHVTLLRRGINGAKSRDLAGGGAPGGARVPSLAETVARDRPTIVSIFIGVNDVWHPDADDGPAGYGGRLRALAAAAAVAGARVVICTPAVIGERPRGANPHDAMLDAYAEAARAAARESGATLCDLRAAFLEEIAKRAPGSADGGVFTHDGVHMRPEGDALIARTMAGALRAAAAGSEPPDVSGVVPRPRSVRPNGRAAFRPDARTRVVVPSAAGNGSEAILPHAMVFAEELARIFGRRPEVVRDPTARPGDIALRLDGAARAADDESYRIDVDGGAAPALSVRAASAAGIMRGTATALHLLGAGAPVPGIAIEDAPAHAFRALLVDVARQPHSPETLRRLIVLCRLYKIAYLQLHLTDDQAFTFPSKAFPRLATPAQHFTPEELAALVKFAGARGVTLIPEIEMPGHAGAMVEAMPGLFRAHEKHHATLNFARPEALDALDTLLAEVAAAFPDSPYIHIGGDEADLAHVAETPDFRAAFAREGVADAEGLYRRFLGRMNATVRRLGRRTLVWEGFGPGGGIEVPRDITVVAYESLYYLPDRLAQDGFRIVNASWKPLYVVNDRHWTPREIHAWNPRLFQHFIESYPAGHGIQLSPAADVAGAMMCAWEQPDALELPSLRGRLPAMAERVWNPGCRTAYPEFETRWRRADALLTRLVGP